MDEISVHLSSYCESVEKKMEFPYILLLLKAKQPQSQPRELTKAHSTYRFADSVEQQPGKQNKDATKTCRQTIKGMINRSRLEPNIIHKTHLRISFKCWANRQSDNVNIDAWPDCNDNCYIW